MARQLDLNKPIPIRRAAYLTVRMALRLRYQVPKPYKKIFDLEGDNTWWDAPIELKAQRVGITTEEYQASLDFFDKHPIMGLGIVLLRTENNFLKKWWVHMIECEKMAEQMMKEPVRTVTNEKGQVYTIDNRFNAIKALVMVEREKMMGIKRLVETGRMIDPSAYSRETVKSKKRKEKPIIDDKGVLDVEKIP